MTKKNIILYSRIQWKDQHLKHFSGNLRISSRCLTLSTRRLLNTDTNLCLTSRVRETQIPTPSAPFTGNFYILKGNSPKLKRKWWEVCNLIKMILIIIKNWWATSLLEEAFVFFLSIKFNLSIIQFHSRFEHELNYGDRWHLVTSTHILILNKVKTAKSVIHWYSFLLTHHQMIMTITTYKSWNW